MEERKRGERSKVGITSQNNASVRCTDLAPSSVRVVISVHTAGVGASRTEQCFTLFSFLKMQPSFQPVVSS